MDGIAGVIYPDIFQTDHLVDTMLRTLKHRSKTTINDSHTYKNFEIGLLGHRLSSNERQTIYAAIDGTLYNTDPLRHQLMEQGYLFTSQEDAELLVHGYECEGTDFFSKLTGDFSIMILDQETEQITLVRDRIGKKPLYWYQDQHYFLFGSELKALLATGAIPQTPATDALASYLYLGYIPQDMTPIKNVNKLLPGHFLQISTEKSLSIQSYWSYSSFFQKQETSPQELVISNLDSLLSDSVQKRLPKDNSIGCLISGGLGSASVAYYVKKLVESGPKAYTVGFLGENDADIEAAKAVSSSLKLPHHCEIITPNNFLDDLVNITWHLDEPLADPNTIATWKLLQLAKTHSNVVFSGMGSDELLAGHTRYTIEERHIGLAARLKETVSPSIIKFLLPILHTFYKPAAYHLLKESKTNPWQFEYIRHNALFNESQLAAASPRLASLFDPEVFLHKFYNLNKIQSPVASYLYFDVKTRLADCFMLQLERLTAAHTLEWRTPYLDRTIVEFLAALPEPAALKEQETASFLKQLLKDTFPPTFINRPKTTRKNFLKTWVHKSDLGELFDCLPNGTLVESGLISENWLRKAILQLKTNGNNFRHIWGIFALEIWFRIFINHPVASHPPDISVKELLLEK